MKLSNVQDYVRHGSNELDWRYTATVDVTTGYLWWKKTTTRKVARTFAGFWFFMDDGAYTPDSQMERLEKPISFKNGW